MSQELQELAREAYALPYGRAHSALLEQVVARADAEDEAEAAFGHRLKLAFAYSQGGEPRLSFVPFARCVSDLDADPARFGRFTYELLWGYKAIVHSMTYFPEIDLSQTAAMLDEMERRYAAAGYGLHAVHQHRWMVAFHVGDLPGAEEHFRAWTSTPRDALADCRGCDPNEQVKHLHWVGRDEEAVALGLETLSQSLGCVEQPQSMQTGLLAPLVAQGRVAEARDHHQRGYRTMRTLAAQLPGLADHLRFATATGNLDRAREIFERHVVELREPTNPLDAMVFSAVASRLLRELAETDPGLVVGDEHAVPSDAALLADRYAREARALGARFDARNQTAHQGDRVERLLTEARWVDHLPLLLPIGPPTGAPVEVLENAAGERVPEVGAPAEQAAAGPEPTPSLSSSLPDADALPVDGLLDLVDDALGDARLDVVRAALDRFEAARPATGWTALEAGRVDVARAGLAEDAGDGAATTEALRSALLHLDAAGDTVRLQRARALLGLTLAAQGEVDEATATGDAALAWLVEHDEPDRRFGWDFRRMRLDLAAGRAEQVYDALRRLFATPGADEARNEYVALMLTQEELNRGRFAEAEGSASRARGSKDPDWWRWSRRFRADARRAQGDAAGAVEDRLEAIAGSAEVPDAATDPVLVLDLGDDYLAADRVSEAAEAGEVALRLTGPDGRPDLLERARLQLLGAYRRLDEPALALDQVRALQDDITDETPALWRAQLLGEQGSLLLWLSRWVEARAALVDAAATYEVAGEPGGQVRSLRQAQAAALESGAREEAWALWEQAMQASTRMPEETSERWFQQGWLWLERAALDLQTDDRDAAAAAFEHAGTAFHQGGFADQATEAALRRAEGLGADVEDLRALFVAAAPGDNGWYRSGWLLADRLRADGRTAESDTLEAELEGTAGGASAATS